MKLFWVWTREGMGVADCSLGLFTYFLNLEASNLVLSDVAVKVGMSYEVGFSIQAEFFLPEIVVESCCIITGS